MQLHQKYTGTAQDFDFLYGHWKIHNKRLLKRLEGCTTWEEFSAHSHAEALPGGIGNLDRFEASDWRPDFLGLTLRIYNPHTQQWSIYWVDNHSAELQAPVLGGFKGKVGIFEGDDSLHGIAIRVRFIWTVLSATAARWEQAFSTDSGRSWETNWVMELRRA